ncbi:MAG: hypothetical protein WBM66_14760, partial [Thiothrix litoralis]
TGAFCPGITRAEYSLLYYIVGSRLNEVTQVQKVVAEYVQAMSYGVAPRQLRFINEHLNFLRTMLGEFQEEKRQLQPVVMAILAIEEKLSV